MVHPKAHVAVAAAGRPDMWIRFGPGVGGRYAAAVELVLISGSGIALTIRGVKGP